MEGKASERWGCLATREVEDGEVEIFSSAESHFPAAAHRHRDVFLIDVVKIDAPHMEGWRPSSTFFVSSPSVAAAAAPETDDDIND